MVLPIVFTVFLSEGGDKERVALEANLVTSLIRDFFERDFCVFLKPNILPMFLNSSIIYYMNIFL
jgi:hypothetical protein